MSNIPTIKLNNGLQMPMIGLGTFKESDEEKLVKAVKAAIDAGYRHFDCAYIYYNERHVARGIKESIEESNGKLKREDFFIVSKCYNTFHSKERVKVAIEQSLKEFGLDYLDLYLVHWPMGFIEGPDDYPSENGQIVPGNVPYLETYHAMEELVQEGKVKSIGISNFNIEQMTNVLNNCKIKPVCNQFEVHPLLQNHEWVDFCQKNDIVVVAYAPLGAPDRPWRQANEPVLLEQPKLLEIAKKYNKTTAQVILRWLIQLNIVPIPKSVTPSRIAENAQIFDFELTAEDMDVFKMFLADQYRYYSWIETKNHPDYPF